MADINIQRKKKSLSPWLAVLLALAVLGLIWFFFFRADPETPVDAIPPATSTQPLGTTRDSAAASAMDDMATEEAATPQAFYAFAADSAATDADYGRHGLRLLAGVLVTLADRNDLRQDAAVLEKRNDLTSATSRLEEPSMSLRPGFMAAAAVLQAIQQKAYPDLAAPVNQLADKATALSGRDEPAQRELQRAFFTQAAQILHNFS